jgi:ArsR family transcriptional regulator
MRDIISIAKALADETRLRALLALRGRELCLCQLIELLGLATSTVSKHMAVLHQAGLVERRKAGRWAYYRLPGGDAPAAVRQALAWARDRLAGEVRVREDAKHLKSIIGCDPEVLCRRQRSR